MSIKSVGMPVAVAAAVAAGALVVLPGAGAADPLPAGFTKVAATGITSAISDPVPCRGHHDQPRGEPITSGPRRNTGELTATLTPTAAVGTVQFKDGARTFGGPGRWWPERRRGPSPY